MSASAKKYALAIVRLLACVVSSARSCQTLPLLTVLLALHVALHWFVIQSAPDNFVRSISSALLFVNAILNAIGYILIVQLYAHSVRTIFNRNVPSDPQALASSFGVHLSLLRPLEIIWRFLTAHLRVLPDVIVLGEVRCGTTSLCAHLSSIPGVVEPFCLWKHPELDGKETFYFVGHYLGYVSPSHYRMCFPMKLTKWWYNQILKRPFLTFDGCAQYLSSPTAAALILQAYRDAGEPLPIMVACVRDPVDQAVSWWRYENNAMAWGQGMGLRSWNTALRSDAYPPESLESALEYSKSPFVENLYVRAECLTKSGELRWLPPWAMTWPGGQLTGIGRNGRFARNILQFEKMAREVVGGCHERQEECIERLQYVTVAPLEALSDEAKVKDLLSMIYEGVLSRKNASRMQFCATASKSFFGTLPLIHRNSGVGRMGRSDPSVKEKEMLMKHFAGDIAELEKLL